MLWRLLLCLCLLGLAFSRYFIVGPAQLTILNYQPCKNYSNSSMRLDLKTSMYNASTQQIEAFLNLPIDIDDNVTMDLKCSRVDKHKIQVNSFVLNDAEMCPTLVKYAGDLFEYFQKQVGFEPGVCPMKKGNYSVKDMVFDLAKLNVQMLLEGQFKTQILIKQFSKPFYCMDFTLELSPLKQ